MVGTPAAVGLTAPDNVEFGPDGFLYVSEDVGSSSGRIIRIADDGTHSVFADGFHFPQGLAFDPTNGDLYLAEQGVDSIWRVAVVPEPGVAGLLGFGVLWFGCRRS